eukprot:11533455-Ditylum_brightwellii.AAC.1
MTMMGWNSLTRLMTPTMRRRKKTATMKWRWIRMSMLSHGGQKSVHPKELNMGTDTFNGKDVLMAPCFIGGFFVSAEDGGFVQYK